MKSKVSTNIKFDDNVKWSLKIKSNINNNFPTYKVCSDR